MSKSTIHSSLSIKLAKLAASLLSYHVPGTDGVKLVRFIRALDHRLTAAVVMVTANSEVTEQARAAGADEVLLKPINPNALVCAVGKHVS